jgi:hypothetical protein
MLPFDLSGVVEVNRLIIFQNHFPEGSKVHRLLIFIVQGYALHFTFHRALSRRGAKDRECVAFSATRDKLFNVGASAKLQLICEVAQIVACLHFAGLTYFTNVNDRICVAVQHRLARSSQALVQFQPCLGCHVCCSSNVDILPCGKVFLGMLPRNPLHVIVPEYEVSDLNNRTSQKFVKHFL